VVDDQDVVEESERACSTIQLNSVATPDRSASAPPVDHAGPPPGTNQQVNGYVQSLGHPQHPATEFLSE
jgi:hypothetical protein